ncbi:hypothetical protein [Roseibacillus persicicus]|uniref:hypothetical protein n=1 Tax=Roseibacillus persicicus TaxID=454148 RepID=UPI00280C44AB|nr:hypothetical protein [Roseibacillus persicicus]MDQ8192446.1 hypothetical protein [Roseibacillus persicicus]
MLSRYIHPKEDTLTASVLGHLLHLPIEIFWELLRESCDGHALPEKCGEPLAIEPWPKWSAEGTSNTHYIEPDLFLRFESFDLIIEAKRWDYRMQNKQQWKNQLIAYQRDYGTEEQPVHYLALGGLWTLEPQELSYGDCHTCFIYKARWQGILSQCQRLLRQHKAHPFPSSQDHAHTRLLEDLIDLFAVHGFSTGRWYEDFQFHRNRPSFQSTLPTSNFTPNY